MTSRLQLIGQCGLVGRAPFLSLRRRVHIRASSARSEVVLDMLPSYLADARSVPAYDARNKPDGALNLSVAENRMVEDLLRPRLSQISEDLGFPESAIYYQSTHGTQGAREAMCVHMSNVMTPKDSERFDFKPDNVVLGAGCNAVLENLFFCITEPGESVLVPSPYYAAFDFDLGARLGLKMLHAPPASLDTADLVTPAAYYPTPQSLEAAYVAGVAKGHTITSLLLTSPNNPLGVCYPAEVLRACVDWATAKGMHVVSDEIYAGCVFRDELAAAAVGQVDEVEWTSMAAIAPVAQGGPLPENVHIVYALSKDFGLSGLRVGAAYSDNEAVLTPLRKLNDLCQVSSHTQRMVEALLQPDSVKTYTAETHLRVAARYTRLTTLLHRLRVPYLPGGAGLFLWMDLRAWLPPTSATGFPSAAEAEADAQAREQALYVTLGREHGLLFTPGLSMLAPEPGFMRCVFTACLDHEFELILARLERAAAAMAPHGNNDE